MLLDGGGRYTSRCVVKWPIDHVQPSGIDSIIDYSWHRWVILAVLRVVSCHATNSKSSGQTMCSCFIRYAAVRSTLMGRDVFEDNMVEAKDIGSRPRTPIQSYMTSEAP